MMVLRATISYIITSRFLLTISTSSAFQTIGTQKVAYCRHPPVSWSHPRFTNSDSAVTEPFSLRPKHNIERPSGINFHLIRTLVLNQICMLSFAIAILCSWYFLNDNAKQILLLKEGIFNWSDQVISFPDDRSFMINPILIGVFGSLPPILIGIAIDRSDDYRFAKANFSTVYMVMAIFGRRAVTPSYADDQSFNQYSKSVRLHPHTNMFDVILWSAIISLITGISEELIFRCILPSILSTIFHNSTYLIYFIQAVLFALGHTSIRVSFRENAPVGGFQFINGLWFGGFFLFSDGDVISCIVAHALYDFQTFICTWTLANDQVEYAYYKSQEPLPKDEMMALKQLGYMSPRFIQDFKKVFYIFDTDKNGTMSLSEARKGIAYLAIDDDISIPPQLEIDTLFQSCLREQKLADQLGFPDFVKMVLSLKVRKYW